MDHKCTIGVPLLGICIVASQEPSPTTKPTTQPTASPEPTKTPTAPAITLGPTQEAWQPPATQRPEVEASAPITVSSPIVTAESSGTPWAPEPSPKTDEATIQPVTPTTPAAVAIPEEPDPSIYPTQNLAMPRMAEQTSDTIKEQDLNLVFIGSIFVHLGIALIWLALVHMPSLWRARKRAAHAKMPRGVRQPRHLRPQRSSL